MGQRHVAVPLAFTGRLPFWPAEERQEIVSGHHAVRQLDRPHAGGQPFELRAVAGGNRDRIEHLLGAQTTRQGVREIDVVVLVPLVFVDRELIRPREADVAHQVPHVEVALEEILLERLEQFRVARRITAADVVHRINDAAREEIAPRAIGHRLGEIRIVLRYEPIHKCHAPVPILRRLLRFADGHFRSHVHPGLRILHLAIVLPIDNLLAGHLHQVAGETADGFLAERTALDRHAREVSAKLVVLLLRPLLKRMIMALVAVEPNAEEGLAHVLGNLARVAQRPVVIHLRVPIRTALGQQHLANKFVVRLVLRDGVLNPIAEHPDTLLP